LLADVPAAQDSPGGPADIHHAKCANPQAFLADRCQESLEYEGGLEWKGGRKARHK